MAVPVRDDLQLSPLEMRLLRYIQRSADVGSRGPCLSDLLRSTNARQNEVQASLARLLDAGLIQVSTMGRYYPVSDDMAPVEVSRLSAEELARVRRGEPSTGRQVSCAGLPSAVTFPVVQAPPMKVVATNETRGRKRVSDLEIVAAIRQHRTHREAARAVGLTHGAFSKRAKALGLGRGCTGRPRKVSDEEILRVMRQCATRKEAAQRLGIKVDTLYRRLRLLRQEARP